MILITFYILLTCVLVPVPNIVKSLRDSNDAPTFDTPPFIGKEIEPLPQLTPRKKMPLIDPLDLVGRSFYKDMEDEQRLRVKIVKDLEACEEDLEKILLGVSSSAPPMMIKSKRSYPTTRS